MATLRTHISTSEAYNAAAFKKLLIVSASLLLASCATPPITPAVVSDRSITVPAPAPKIPNDTPTQDKATPLEERSIDIERAEYYQNLAQTGPEQKKVDSQLSAAENYIQAQEYFNAEQRILGLESASLSDIQKDRLSIISAYVAYARQDFQGALNKLAPVTDIIYTPLTPEVEPNIDEVSEDADPAAAPFSQPKALSIPQVDALLLSSFCHQKLGNYDAAIAALLVREASLVGEARSETTRYIWQVIDTIDRHTRESIIGLTQNTLVASRLEQSLLGQVGQQDIAPRQFSQWREEKTEQVKNIIDDGWNANSPKSIAVLLPLNSKFNKAAQAVMDGIKYQNELNESDYKPEIQFYDIGQNSVTTPQYYRAAVNAGADFIIGPLGTEYADTVTALSGPRVATLLLGGENPIGGSTVRFSMSPEQEGERAAERALSDGHLSIAILTNQSPKNQRIINAFSDRWLAAGGKINTVISYDKTQYDHSLNLKQLFNISDSEFRYSELSNTLGFKPKFNAYKRNDLDAILMLADNDSGRIVRPQINFFSGSRIPVYSTSAIFNGIPDSINNMDLDDTHFPVMPWVFKSRDSASYAGQLNQLFALGADAYLVAGNYTQLKNNAEFAINANTGQLNISDQSLITSKPLWAKFKKGDAVIIESNGIDISPTNSLGQPLERSLNGINPQNQKGIYNDQNWNTRESKRKTGS